MLKDIAAVAVAELIFNDLSVELYLGRVIKDLKAPQDQLIGEVLSLLIPKGFEGGVVDRLFAKGQAFLDGTEVKVELCDLDQQLE